MTQSERTPPTPAPEDADDQAPRDPVTGTSDNATGPDQAAENEENDPVA